MFALIAFLAPSLALAGQLVCEDPAKSIRLVAELPAGVSMAQPEHNLKLDSAAIEIDAQYNWRGTGPIQEAANGGAQWDEYSGLIAVRGVGTNTLVSFRIDAWNEKGEGIGRFENGAGAGAPHGICRYEE